MKKNYFLLLTLLISVVSFGQTIITENFDYGAVAGDLVAQSGGIWASHSGSTAVGYATTSLTMASYPSSGVGGSATIVGSNSQDVNRTFTSVTTGNIYASTLVNLSTVSAGGNYFYHFRDAGGGFFGRAYARDDGTGKILFGVREGGGTIVYGTTPFDLNTTYLLVLKYDLTAGAASIYVLSAVVGTEPGTTEATSADGTDATSIAAIALRQSGGIPTCTVDGIRVATTWTDLMVESTSPATVVSSAVSGLDYEVSNGPSAEGSFTVSGTNLTNDIIINAPTDFEISETSGGTFGASVTLPFGGGTVATTTIYARLKVGLAISPYSGDVNITSTGATPKIVSLSGEVYNTLTNALAIIGAFDVLTGFSPRGMEIEVLADIPDLSIFGVGSATNGNGGGVQEFTFPAVAATTGDKIYVIGSGHLVAFNTFFAPLVITGYESGAFNINGDDGLEIFENGQIIDVFGDVNTDGTGQPWEYLDGWAYRSVAGPSTTFITAYWTYTLGDLDGATNIASTTPYPGAALSVRENNIEGFAVYPNPVNNGEFSISSISNASKQVQIFDMLGKSVYSNEIQANENVLVSNLNSGIYILRVIEEGKTATRKLVIQ
ncbi:MAG: T9SS type A sorting domain-containing protein [Flavobacteriaceae bacterium]|nr:T9SS type A sorting domain-containing protein [Flavobacteriaceae bacterium]